MKHESPDTLNARKLQRTFAAMNAAGTPQQNIRHLSLPQLQALFEELGEKKFRAKQVWEWLWKKSAASFDDMTDLSKELRQKLSGRFTLPALKVGATQHSTDGTVKFSFVTVEGYVCEGVLIPTENRYTACVSSQIGCSLSCKFCATGYLPRKRNLSFDEIYDEVVLINRECENTFGKKLTNIVFMGMGEPLLNYRNVLAGIERITAMDGLGMSNRRITVSTAGVAKQIKQLGDDGVKFNLALSLHAATDKKRGEIMPINDSNNIAVLIEALNYFHRKTKGEITFEYILFNNFNDSIEDANQLIKICRQVPTHMVNVIEYNPIDFAQFQKPSEERSQAFIDYLAKHRVNARIRRSRGKDIDAACGQLANKLQGSAA